MTNISLNSTRWLSISSLAHDGLIDFSESILQLYIALFMCYRAGKKYRLEAEKINFQIFKLPSFGQRFYVNFISIYNSVLFFRTFTTVSGGGAIIACHFRHKWALFTIKVLRQSFLIGCDKKYFRI